MEVHKDTRMCVWWVIIGQKDSETEKMREGIFILMRPACASVKHPEKMNLLLLFIFMNSCHLAQCEMIGHSRGTRRAGTEFKITHTNPPSIPFLPSTPNPTLPHFIPLAWIC